MPENIYRAFNACEKGSTAEAKWNELFTKYEQQYPKLAAEFLRRSQGFLPEAFSEKMDKFVLDLQQTADNVATRKASEMVLDFVGELLPEMIGGSADLTGSNNTKHKSSRIFSHENPAGNYLSYGVRSFM